MPAVHHPWHLSKETKALNSCPALSYLKDCILSPDSSLLFCGRMFLFNQTFVLTSCSLRDLSLGQAAAWYPDSPPKTKCNYRGLQDLKGNQKGKGEEGTILGRKEGRERGEESRQNSSRIDTVCYAVFQILRGALTFLSVPQLPNLSASFPFCWAARFS